MKRIYLDNAATTPLDPVVFEAMVPYMKEHFGNPSSIHGFGRTTRAAVETSRRQVAKMLNVTPGEICFTSGGTEADNMAINCAVNDLGIKHAITSAIEHKAVLQTLQHLEAQGKIKLSLVNLKEDGVVDLEHLEQLLQTNERTFVSLMHGNNEVGNILPLKKVGALCESYDAIFHSDTVQTMGHFPLDLGDINIHFITCAAHKFHGPKGAGFLYINKDIPFSPMILGGGQERNRRGGTEYVYGIVGLAKALEIATNEMEEHKAHVLDIKFYMKEQLEQHIPGVDFNGLCSRDCLYTVLNVCFPHTDKADMLLYSLDIDGIAVSGGSACSSGADAGSHVLRGINADMSRPSIRFSFSKFNTREEIDYCVSKLKELFAIPVA